MLYIQTYLPHPLFSISYNILGNANKYAKSGAYVCSSCLHTPIHAEQSKSADNSWQAWTSTQPGSARCSQEGTHGLSKTKL